MATATEVRGRATTATRTDTGKLVGRIVTYALMILLALIFMLPMLWMLSTSLRPKSQLFTQQIHWIPQTWSLESYQKLFNNTAVPIGRWFTNSVLVAIAATVLIL